MKMVCHNCGREFVWGVEYKGHLFCSQICIDEWRISMSTADHAQLTENLVDSQSDSATNSQEERR